MTKIDFLYTYESNNEKNLITHVRNLYKAYFKFNNHKS